MEHLSLFSENVQKVLGQTILIREPIRNIFQFFIDIESISIDFYGVSAFTVNVENIPAENWSSLHLAFTLHHEKSEVVIFITRDEVAFLTSFGEKVRRRLNKRTRKVRTAIDSEQFSYVAFKSNLFEIFRGETITIFHLKYSHFIFLFL